MKLTILTPTYNRVENLKKIYNSLLKQINQNFCWFVIDDGSTDNTEEIIKKMKKENLLNIIYEKKENGGKHTALNYAIKNIDTELIFIVDSDDWLEKNAVEEVYKIHKKYESDEKICGYSFLRKYSNGKINNKKFPKNELLGNYIDVRINGNIGGDKAEVFKTKCLKEFPFPEFVNEKFLGEDIVWIDMALKYDMVHFNEAIYVSEYLENGLTKNRRKNNIKSPMGCFERSKRLMYKQCNLKTRIKGLLSYIVYGRFAHISLKNMLKEYEWNKFMFFLTLPCGILIYNKWKREVNGEFNKK